jgi:Pectate lyase superfamily protein
MSDVRDFGAVGDGQADDTEALQHAIDDGDGLVRFPRGNYRITRSLDVELAQVGRTALDGSGGTAKLVMAGPGPALIMRGTHAGSADPADFRPEEWERERLPIAANLEIEGQHAQADGIRLEGVMQPTLTGLLIRRVRTAVHVTQRARNLLISHCHFYHNTGIGVHLDSVNLHQAIITGSHISYCRRGGIRIENSEIRNLQITGNDIEYNNHGTHPLPEADAEPTAEIYLDVRAGTVREGTIASNTIQATYSPGGANIRFLGAGAGVNHKAGMWTIVGNLIGSQETNVHLTSVRGIALNGNYLYSGHHRNLLVEGSRDIVLGPNCFGHNPDYGDQELCTGIRFVDCENCTVTGLLIQDALAGEHTVADAVPIQREGLVEFIRCRRVTMTGSQVLDGVPHGIYLEDCRDTLLSGCTVLETRPAKLMRTAVRWQGQGSGNLIVGCRVGSGSEGIIVAEHAVRQADNMTDE